MHLNRGVVRSIVACDRYGIRSVSEITSKFYADIGEGYKEDAWSYLDKEAEKK